LTSKKGNGRFVREHVAAVVRNLLDLSIGTARRAVKRVREMLVPAVEIERADVCSRCHRDLAGDYLIWLEHVWCLDCFDRARGGTVFRPEPVDDVRAENELRLVN